MIGKHFEKKFSKKPPPGIMVIEVVEKEFSEKIETFGTAVSNKTKSFRIKKEDLIKELKLNNYVKKGDAIIKLKSGNIIAPFNGVVGVDVEAEFSNNFIRFSFNNSPNPEYDFPNNDNDVELFNVPSVIVATTEPSVLLIV